MKKIKILYFLGISLFLFSCSSERLTTRSVGYQSIRTINEQPTIENPIPDDAKIAVAYTFSKSGDINAIVYNRTDEIMTIDQTKSFFVNTNGTSTSYFDPTVRTTSTTGMNSSTGGGTVHLGSIADVLGIGGVVGTVLNGINLGGSGTSGQSITNATYVSDLPQVSLAPKSNGAMSKIFHVRGLGKDEMQYSNERMEVNLSNLQAPYKFSVCISYSFDGGRTFNKIVTNFYINSNIIVPVAIHGETNEALRKIYQNKPDALYESWWMIHFTANYLYSCSDYVEGILYDYQ